MKNPIFGPKNVIFERFEPFSKFYFPGCTTLDMPVQFDFGMGQQFFQLSSKQISADSQPVQISLWCFDASKSIQALLRGGVRNLILTSGTLSPLDEYTQNLGLSAIGDRPPVELINDHVVDPSQVYVTCLTKGFNGIETKNIFANRENASMYHGMATSIAKIKSVTPGGMLIFHPTYALMNKMREYWKIQDDAACMNATNNQFQRQVFIEPNDKGELEVVTGKYETAIEEHAMNGAIYMGVCRGKLSEGVDFSDARGRVVVITGIPYAPFMDPKVKLKKEYVQQRYSQKMSSITGDEWYQIQASVQNSKI